MSLFTLSRGRRAAALTPALLPALALFGALAAGTPALAQEKTAPATTAQTAPAAPQKVDPMAVVATVNGDPIREADLQFAAEDLAQELTRVAPNERKAFLTTVLIDMKMMAQAAKADNLQDSDTYKMRLKYLEDRALRRAFFTDKITKLVDDAAIQAAYDKMKTSFKPQEEVDVRHILVSTEDAAKKIRKEIEGGKPFAIAAMENSIDPGTSKKGGELGFIVKGQTDKAFEKAAFSLPVGQISEPVKSQFGWHLIEVNKKGETSMPPLAQVKAQIQQQLLIQAFNDEINTLKSNAKVTFTDPNMAAAVAAEEKKGVQ